MFNRGIKLFRLLGFEVRVDASWFFIAVLITWSLALGFFPSHIPYLSLTQYWILGVLGTLGLFVSIILHELCHSLVARQYGLPMKGITLFLFGGVAEMSDEPPNPKAEFLMAGAGPLFSVLFSVFLFGVLILGSSLNWPGVLNISILYLASINLILAIFNLVPAFPLDGGRMFRAMLWYWKKDIRKATHIATGFSTFFTFIFIGYGVLNLLVGNIVAAIWWSLIGIFIKNAASLSYQQLLMREMLSGEPVSHFMNTHPVTVPPSITLDEFVENYVYKYHHKLFPVMDESGNLSGCIDVQKIKNIPHQQWQKKYVSEIANQCDVQNTINSEEDAIRALSRMNQTGNSSLLVTDKNHLLGLVTLKDILKFLTLKFDLEGHNSHMQRI